MIKMINFCLNLQEYNPVFNKRSDFSDCRKKVWTDLIYFYLLFSPIYRVLTAQAIKLSELNFILRIYSAPPEHRKWPFYIWAALDIALFVGLHPKSGHNDRAHGFWDLSLVYNISYQAWEKTSLVIKLDKPWIFIGSKCLDWTCVM